MSTITSERFSIHGRHGAARGEPSKADLRGQLAQAVRNTAAIEDAARLVRAERNAQRQKAAAKLVAEQQAPRMPRQAPTEAAH